MKGPLIVYPYGVFCTLVPWDGAPQKVHRKQHFITLLLVALKKDNERHFFWRGMI